MSYCLAIKTNEGLVFASDSRTHGGVDQVNTYRKMHRFAVNSKRYFVLLSSGNLATTQAVVKSIERDLEHMVRKRGFASMDTLFDAADYVGKLSREVQTEHEARNSEGASFEASFILGGQVQGRDPNLYLIYPEGNTIAVPETHPFLQIGETKYGKPILDRIVTDDVPLADAARCALVSIDSTMRSNLAVGPPIEVEVYRSGTFSQTFYEQFPADSETLLAIQESWAATLRQGMSKLPRFDWETP